MNLLMSKMVLVLHVVSLLAVSVAFSGCSRLQLKKSESAREAQVPGRATRLAKIGMEMLDPLNSKYDPEKGRTYLEYALKSGELKTVNIPSSTLLEVLKTARTATEKSRTLEQQLEIMKEIDMTHEEQL
jgi:hypothetical protein